MDISQAILLGIIQGITEFLPISSSGHLVIFQQLLGHAEPQLTFDTFLHLATLLAIIIFFFAEIIKIRKKSLVLLIIATIPITIFGLLINHYGEFLFSSIPLVAITLGITGIINLLTDRKLEKRKQEQKTKTEIKRSDALIIGIFQALAVIPGISRSGSTLFASINQKLDRQTAFNFSFLLAIPAILGAVILQSIKLYQQGFNIAQPINFLAGGIAAFFSGLLSLAFLNFVIKKARFEWFALYCITLSVITMFLFINLKYSWLSCN
ncbi:MAG: undecaprenyl-diphosphate phosphatase [Candidatus Woesebacteria bacterium]|jgi:undecaprenyl-diphosphatase